MKIWRKSGQILLSTKGDLVAFFKPLSYPNESPIKCLKTTQHYSFGHLHSKLTSLSLFPPIISLFYFSYFLHLLFLSFFLRLLLRFFQSVQSMAAVATQPQFHVLAVDDSVLDRKLIERLLKTSSYQGILVLLFDFVANCLQ